MAFPGNNNNISILDFVRHRATNGDMVDKLVIANVLVYALDVVLWLPFKLFGQTDIFNSVRDWLLVSDNIGQLVLKPWSLLSYMFMHHDILHVFFNMLVLYIFGKILLEFLGNRKVLPIFVLGGITGALTYVLLFNLFPFWGGAENSVLLGASGGVSAVMVAAAVMAPHYRIFLLLFGAVKIVHIAAVFIAFDIFMLPFNMNTGGRLAHLGGALFGYLFVRQLQAGNDWSKGFNKVADKIFTFFRGIKIPTSGKGMKVKYQQEAQGKTGAASPDGEGQKTNVQKSKQEKVDAILDKIAENGYDSLSKEEKEFLFKYSKE